MGILVGVVLAYDAVAKRAKIKMRRVLRRGDYVQVVGARTDVEFKLKAPLLCARSKGASGYEQYEMNIHSPFVEPGDMVFHLLNVQPAFATVEY